MIPDEEPYVDPDLAPTDKTTERKTKTWIIVIIVCGIVLIAAIIAIVLLVLRLKKFRKRRAAELIDDNYEYTSENNIN